MTYEEIVSYATKNIKKTAAKKIKDDIAVEIDIYGEGEGAFYVAVSDGVVKISPYEYYDRDAKICVTGEDLIKIINEEKTVDESLSDGILKIEGDESKARGILAIIRATPKKESSAKRTVSAEKEIVEQTKSPKSKVAKDIKK